jgi:hypothetical protein
VYPHEWTSNQDEERAGYISLEKSEVYAETARGAFKLSGLDKVVKVSKLRLDVPLLPMASPICPAGFTLRRTL